MKKEPTIALLIGVALIAFFAGRSSKPSAPNGNKQSGSEASGSSGSLRGQLSKGTSNADRSVLLKASRQAAATGENLTREQCLLLNSEERLNLVHKGALIFDGLKQSDYLEGVISSLSEEELIRAREILAKAQNRGNFCAQNVWDSLWKQAGRLTPEETLASFGTSRHKSRSDARHVMEGWFETDSQAALAWAQSPKESYYEAAAAAYALTQNAGGDPQKLIESLAALDANEMVLKDCLQDYFDMADVTGTSEGTAAIYDEMSAEMKPHAWSVTMRRLSYTDAQEAVDWLATHASDPGRNYGDTYRLFRELATEDPAGTVEWAASLPESEDGSTHPAATSYEVWKRTDPTAAAAWLETADESIGWVKRLRQ